MDGVHSTDSVHSKDGVHSIDGDHSTDSVHSTDGGYSTDGVHSTDGAHSMDGVHSMVDTQHSTDYISHSTLDGGNLDGSIHSTPGRQHLFYPRVEPSNSTMTAGAESISTLTEIVIPRPNSSIIFYSPCNSVYLTARWQHPFRPPVTASNSMIDTYHDVSIQ